MRGALTQLQVVHALLLRETKTRFGTNQLGYLWAFLEPALWIGLFVGVYGMVGHISPPGMSEVAFLTTGIVPFSLFRDTTHRNMAAIEANKGLLFYPQVRPLDLVLARTLLEAMTYLGVMALFMGGLALWDGTPRIDSLLMTLGGLALASGLGASLGLVCCGLSVYSPTVERLFPTLLRLAFWGSAVFHPVETLPAKMRDILLLNPVAHAVELVRDGWFPGYDARHSDPVYVLSCILVLTFVGLTLERMSRRHMELLS